nr:homeobox protein hd-10 [Quercus suber]
MQAFQLQSRSVLPNRLQHSLVPPSYGMSSMSKLPALQDVQQQWSFRSLTPRNTSSQISTLLGTSELFSPTASSDTQHSGAASRYAQPLGRALGTLDRDATERSLGIHAVDSPVQKRKIKRFRLTHQQSRFLQDEFSRQPRPDTAYRERLSQAIPGLTPRKVQVWFQNRRAKLRTKCKIDEKRMIQFETLLEDPRLKKTSRSTPDTHSQMPNSATQCINGFPGIASTMPLSNENIRGREPYYSPHFPGQAHRPTTSRNSNVGHRALLHAASSSSPSLAAFHVPRAASQYSGAHHMLARSNIATRI